MFLYKGIDESGEIRIGSIDAKDKSEAFELLKTQGIKAIEIKKSDNKFTFKLSQIFKPSQEDISYLLLRISMMLSSGLTLTQALSTVHSQTESRKISQAVIRIKEEIEKGSSIHLAFERAEIFPNFLIEMLKVAERGENLEKILRISSDFLNRSSDIKNRIFNALTYPIFVLILSITSVVIVINLIIPKIAQVLTGFGKDLPLATKFVLFFSNLLANAIYILPVLIILFIYKHKIFNPQSISRLFLKIPIIGKVSYYFNLSRFSKMLSISLSSGIPILKSIELSIGSIGNQFMRDNLKEMTKEVSEGKSLTYVFSKSKIFPDAFVNLINTGEKSGEVEKILNLLAEIYDRQAMRIINLWLRLVEPLVILILGLIIAFIVMSVILPLTEISSGIKR